MKKYLLVCAALATLALATACGNDAPPVEESPVENPVVIEEPAPVEAPATPPTEAVYVDSPSENNPSEDNQAETTRADGREYGDYVIPITSLESLLQLTDGFVYIGRPTCPSCNRFMPQLIEATTRAGTQVYYLNTDVWSTQPGYDAVRQLFDITSVPRMFIVENGEPRRLDIRSGNDGSWETYLAG